jgi:hypothetical protein
MTRWKLLIAAISLCVLLLVAANPAEAAIYRTNGTSSTWSNWNMPGLWQLWNGMSWMNATTIPGAGDTVYIQNRVAVPTGSSVTIATLYVGCAHLMGPGWFYYPAQPHHLRINGSLTVTQDIYVVDDTLEVAGGALNCTGVLYVGLGSGYVNPPGTQLNARRANDPRLILNGGVITILYGTSTANQQHAGGLVFWAGAHENLQSGTVHVEGWLVGADDTMNNRLFDLSASTVDIHLDGVGYPTSNTAFVLNADEVGASRPMKFNNLILNRSANHTIEASSFIEIHQNLTHTAGNFLGSGGGVILSFNGTNPGNWTSTGGSYTNIVPNLDNKMAALTLHSTIMVPGFVLNNPSANFSLFVDPLGAITGSLAVYDGRLWISTGTLEVRGTFQVGQTPPQPSAFPTFDMIGSGTLWVNASLAGANDGDFAFLQGASGSLVAGTIDVEGDFRVDNIPFAPVGTHTLVMSGNVGRTVQIGNVQVPTGFTWPTLILQNFTVAKTGSAPGDLVERFSHIVVNGNMNVLSGRLKAELALTAGSNNLASTEFPGTQGVLALHLILTENNTYEDITVTSLVVTDTGTLNLSTGVGQAALYADVNGDGAFDGGDRLLATAATPTGRTYTFSGFSEIIYWSQWASWIVVYDLTAAATPGATLQAQVVQNADVTMTGLVAPQPWAIGAPVQGGVKTIGSVGTLTVSAGVGNPADAAVNPGTADVPVMQLQMDTGAAEAVTVSAITCSGAGTGDESVGIAGASLYLDTDGDDTFDPSQDTLLDGPQTFSADDGTITFSLSESIPANASRSFFLVYAFDPNAAVGATFRGGVTSSAGISAAGNLTASPILASGTPVWGGTFTIAAATPPPPPRDDDDGSCGGGPLPSGPSALLSWLFLFWSFVIVLTGGRRDLKK